MSRLGLARRDGAGLARRVGDSHGEAVESWNGERWIVWSSPGRRAPLRFGSRGLAGSVLVSQALSRQSGQGQPGSVETRSGLAVKSWHGAAATVSLELVPHGTSRSGSQGLSGMGSDGVASAVEACTVLVSFVAAVGMWNEAVRFDRACGSAVEFRKGLVRHVGTRQSRICHVRPRCGLARQSGRGNATARIAWPGPGASWQVGSGRRGRVRPR